MRSVGVLIPALDPPWPDSRQVAVVTSRDAPLGWCRFAHEVAAAAQPGGHSFPAAERSPVHDADHDKTAFLYRYADLACGYLCLASRLVTGRRSPTEGYRPTTEGERVVRQEPHTTRQQPAH